MEPLKWGILGAAKIAREFVMPAVHASRNGVLSALASQSAERGAAAVAPYPGVAVHPNYDALLADPKVEAVYIPLDNSQHVPWTLKALAAGKHVLCEKPLALAATEFDALIESRDAHGRVVGEAFMVLHHPQWHRCRDLIDSGELGRLRHVDAVFTFYNDNPANIRNQAALGGGALRDIGVYPMVVTRFVSGEEPKQVRALIETDPVGGTDIVSRVSCDFDEFSLDYYVSTRMAQRQDVVFHCENGWIRVRAPFNTGVYGEAVVEICATPEARRLERFPRIDHYQLQVESFAEAVRAGHPFPCSLEFSRGNQRAIDALFDSGARSGEAVSLGD